MYQALFFFPSRAKEVKQKKTKKKTPDLRLTAAKQSDSALNADLAMDRSTNHTQRVFLMA